MWFFVNTDRHRNTNRKSHPNPSAAGVGDKFHKLDETYDSGVGDKFHKLDETHDGVLYLYAPSGRLEIGFVFGFGLWCT